jgi:tRNA (adenine57-N1/adenine58-N1)-methyltransferase catalytic subunit
VDGKNRRYLVTLREGGEFHTHAGIVPHADLVGRPEGVTLRSTAGARYLAVRPTLSDFVLSMPRGAQVVYPKDLGPILMLADVFVGARILEAGVGSGALSMALLRTGASVVGYEIRPDFAATAQRNVHAFLGADVDYRVEERDVYAGIDPADAGEPGLDRIVLDLPEPWRVVKHAEAALRPGGILVSYLPTIGQVGQLREALDAGAFGLAGTVEVLQRSWHVEGQSVRPDHRMVAHTGFLTSARLLVAQA